MKLQPIPCRCCGSRDWDPHECGATVCRWLICHDCHALLDLRTYVLLPPLSDGRGPMPAE